MAKGIPTVKLWRVRLENGQEQCVWAPTRRLALLNYRSDYGFDSIRTIGLVRQSNSSVTIQWKERV